MAIVAAASFPIAHLLAQMQVQNVQQQSLPPSPSPSPPPPATMLPSITYPHRQDQDANSRLARRHSFMLRQQFAREAEAADIQRPSSAPAP